MRRKDLYLKYADTLKKMYAKNGQDTAVCFDKLIYTYRVRKGIIEGGDIYDEIPEDFDWDEFEKDYIALMQD